MFDTLPNVYYVHSMTNAQQAIITGTTFANGHELHSVTFNYGATLTVIRPDTRSYGVARYVVTDRTGRRGYAY